MSGQFRKFFVGVLVLGQGVPLLGLASTSPPMVAAVPLSAGSGLSLASDRTGHQALVYAVTAGSAAQKAGVQAGDIVLSVGGRRVHGYQDAQEQLRAWAGTPVTLQLLRGSQTLEVLIFF